MAIPDDRGDESFADDLNMWRGIVSGRVALLLRSTEIQPAAAPICPPSPWPGGVFRSLGPRFACVPWVTPPRRLCIPSLAWMDVVRSYQR